LAGESLKFTNAISGCPVCTPYRASLMTGQYWLTHGAFMNDVCLSAEAVSIAEAYAAAGYDTGYVGKWHLDGHGRSNFIPRERRQGFDYWKVLECTHNYNDSLYYADENAPLKWETYDAIAQTRDAQQYIRDHAGERPFLLVLSWGPPHAPYNTAPPEYRARFNAADIVLRPNVPDAHVTRAREQLAGYYAHIAALDDCLGDLLETLESCGIADNTVLLFTSDHGDMLHSQGQQKKQRPYEESICVPFLLRYPAAFGRDGRKVDTLLNTPDIMPTLLGLSGVTIPDTVEGADFSADLLAGKAPVVDAALLMCPAPFGQFQRKRHGGREYRGIRTPRHTYTRDLTGPWLLYANDQDPYQLANLCGQPDYAGLQADLDALLDQKLAETEDEFLPAQTYLDRWGYVVDETGTVPYTP
jgi:arylsulfatase A-like enzyme